MTFLLFASLFFFLLSILQQFLLSPLQWLASWHIPGWMGITGLVLVFSWLMGDQ
ncbi:MAG: hypothetical protein MUF72_00340 [Elainella sp. Prado103]|jgi:hypothetical protein|nr:hypothetical protein [Elainella sp. Prado103]